MKSKVSDGGLRPYPTCTLRAVEKAKQFMSRKIKYSDEPIGEPKVIADFLPPPDKLTFRAEDMKATLTKTALPRTARKQSNSVKKDVELVKQ
jgi:hypothetical protein